MSEQTATPPHGRHGDGTGNLKSGHQPVDIRDIGTHGTHDVRHGHGHGKHAERQGDLPGENGQGQHPARGLLWGSRSGFWVRQTGRFDDGHDGLNMEKVS